MKQPGAEELQALHSALNQSLSPFQNLMAFNEFLPLAEMLSKSTIIHETFQGNAANCMLIIEIANRTNSPLVSVAQNLQLVNGKPAWSGKYVIAKINSSGLFDRLKFQFVGEPGGWDYGCFAYTNYAGTTDRVEGVHVTRKVVHDAGWEYHGSPWLSMPDLMYHYRAASFFVNVHAPELLLGLPSVEEAYDAGYTARSPAVASVTQPPPESAIQRVREMLDKAPLPAAPQLIEVSAPKAKAVEEASVVADDSKVQPPAAAVESPAKQARKARAPKNAVSETQGPAELQLFDSEASAGGNSLDANPSPAQNGEAPAAVVAAPPVGSNTDDAAPARVDQVAAATDAAAVLVDAAIEAVDDVPPHLLDAGLATSDEVVVDQRTVQSEVEDVGFFLGEQVEQETAPVAVQPAPEVKPNQVQSVSLATIKEMCLRAESAGALSDVAAVLDQVAETDRPVAEAELLEAALLVLGELNSTMGKDCVVKAMDDLGAIAGHFTSKERYNNFVGPYNARTVTFNTIFPY
jgi:hypothetical protein